MANHGWPWRWVRWRYFGGDIFGGEDILVEENGRMEKVGDFGGKKKEGKKIGKRKENGKRKVFSWNQK